jgi:hypothetical protein
MISRLNVLMAWLKAIINILYNQLKVGIPVDHQASMIAWGTILSLDSTLIVMPVVAIGVHPTNSSNALIIALFYKQLHMTADWYAAVLHDLLMLQHHIL